MRSVVVLVAAAAVLSGCGTDTVARSSVTSTSTASMSPAPAPSPTKVQSVKDKPAGAAEHDGAGSGGATVPADAPACGAVWRDGLRLARDYHGCTAGKQFVTVDQEPCSFGQQLVRFGDHFYAVRGGPVNRTAMPLAKDRTYRGALASCRA
jgi:hypothetical protein